MSLSVSACYAISMFISFYASQPSRFLNEETDLHLLQALVGRLLVFTGARTPSGKRKTSSRVAPSFGDETAFGCAKRAANSGKKCWA